MNAVLPLYRRTSLTVFFGIMVLSGGLYFLGLFDSPGTDPQSLLFRYYEIPRALLALICGAAMGFSGLLIQQVIRNPFASPSTLGINAGAMLGVTLAASLGSHPGLSPIGGLLGGLLSGGLTLLMSSKLGGGPVHVVLIGMIVNLGLNGLAAILLMFFENSLDGLYIWGAGSLHLHEYSALIPLTCLLAAILLASLPLARSLDLFALGETHASSLGVPVKTIQWIALTFAIVLAASVCSVIGMISFIGLIAPHLAQGCGAKTSLQKGLLSLLWGALLLWASDIVARALGGDAISIPAGALTTLLGAPCLLYFLRHKKSQRYNRPTQHGLSLTPAFRWPAVWVVCGLLAFLALGIFSSITWGDDWQSLLHLRIPRLLYAFCAGAGLAIAGMILQLFMRNPLASPDVTGLTHSGVLCVVLASSFFAGLSQGQTIGISILGSSLGLATLLWLNRGTYFSPVRLALTGIVITAITSTITPIIFALSANQTTDALMWLSGTTYTATSEMAIAYAILSIILITPLFLTWRWLNLLHLGNEWAFSLGLPLNLARGVLLIAASLLSGLAIAMVGGITFVGLMAPHGARLLGISNYKILLPVTLLLGSTLLIWADIAAQHLLYPFDLPTGLLVSLIGGLYFIVLMMAGIKIQK